MLLCKIILWLDDNISLRACINIVIWFTEQFYVPLTIKPLDQLQSFKSVLLADPTRLFLIEIGGLLQFKFVVVGIGVGVNIYLWAR